MKTAKEILNNSIGKNVVWSIDGHITVVDELNANDIVSAMERYSEERLKEWKEKLKKRIKDQCHALDSADVDSTTFIVEDLYKLIDSL